MPVLDQPPSLDSLPELITPAEFQAVTRLSRAYVYDLIRRDEIPGVLRFGRCIRIPKTAVNSFVARAK